MNLSKLPAYGSALDGRMLFVINSCDFGLIATTCVFTSRGGNYSTPSLEVEYNYSTSGNTYQHSSAKNITRAEFLKEIKKIKKAFNVNFTILTKYNEPNILEEQTD